MPTCIIAGCKNNSRTSGVSFFKVPNIYKFTKLAIKWTLHAKPAVKLSYNKALTEIASGNVGNSSNIFSDKRCCVCEVHFPANLVNDNKLRFALTNFRGRKKLVTGAYPSLNLGTQNDDTITDFNKCDTRVKVELESDTDEETDLKDELECDTDVKVEQECDTKLANIAAANLRVDFTQKSILLHNPIKASQNQNIKESSFETDTYTDGELEGTNNINDSTCKDHRYAVSFRRKRESQTISEIKGKTMKVLSTPTLKTSLLNPSDVSMIRIDSPGISRFNLIERKSFDEPDNTNDDDDGEEYSFETEKLSMEEKLAKEKKYIVFDSQLDILLFRTKCQTCEKTIDISSITKSSNEDSQLTVRYRCLDGHNNVWRSQPTLGLD